MTPESPTPKRRRYVPAVGPRLKILLAVIFGLTALIMVNSAFLVSVRVVGLVTGQAVENIFYLWNFMGHLALGITLLLPVIVFGLVHIKNAHNRPNRRAVRVGYALFVVSLLLLGSGVVLTQIPGVIVIKDGATRSIAYWIHVIAPILAVWLFVLHRLAGRKIRWKIGLRWAAVGGVFAAGTLLVMTQDPRKWNVEGNPDGEKYFFPSLARTLTGDFIPEKVLNNDQYCQECHEDVHASWQRSVHKFSSFNNPPYLASVRATRKAMLERDGTINGSRFCAGCHDPVPFFTGKFNDPNYDDVNDPTAHAGITCTACHAITHVNSVKGNGAYTIDEPIHYPFAFSENKVLKWINRQLVKAKPGFHKKTFLKPLHKSTEFCGTCHKVHLPVELNDYKWLRGQNHYDSFLLSGVSGIGVTSFYYPPEAQPNCNECHMPLIPSNDFGSSVRDDSGIPKSMGHQFPSANAAIPRIVGDLGRLSEEQVERAIAAHREFNDGVMRLDIFGIKEGARIDSELQAPLRPAIPTLKPGQDYLLETVIRTVKMGHLFTQGTVDSNQVWMDVTVESDGKVIGRSGGMNEEGSVDPWSHFVNAFVLDRDGNRIATRNAEDIFIALYNHQIPPGATDVIHYRLDVPEDVGSTLKVTVKLQYRKFDTEYMRFVNEDPSYVNDLPILLLAEDTIEFPIEGRGQVTAQESKIPEWQRWNDYGIGLFRKGDRGELRQAEEAFLKVEELGRPDGPVNLARVYVKEGRVQQEAPEALRRAREFDPPANEWSLLWFSGLINKQNGHLNEAIKSFQQIIEGGFEQAKGRGFDFSKDYRLLNELAGTLYERAKQERGEARAESRTALMEEAEKWFTRVLELDPENVSAHYGLKQVYRDLGDSEKAEYHAERHLKYKPDDNARDRAIANARRQYPAANQAAEEVVIYDLQRDGGDEFR